MGTNIRYDRIKKGDKILVTILAEPIQEIFDNLHEIAYQIKDLMEEIEENGGRSKAPKELIEKTCRLKAEAVTKREAVWLKIQENYNLWGHNIAIRRGYCIVEVTDNEIDNLFKRFLKDIGGNFDIREGPENPKD